MVNDQCRGFIDNDSPAMDNVRYWKRYPTYTFTPLGIGYPVNTFTYLDNTTTYNFTLSDTGSDDKQIELPAVYNLPGARGIFLAILYLENFQKFTHLARVNCDNKIKAAFNEFSPSVTATNFSSKLFDMQNDQTNIMTVQSGTDSPYVLNNPRKLAAMHDALSDYVIAPLGRVNHLQGLMTGISLQANNVDTTEGRLKYEDYHLAQDFLKRKYPGAVMNLNSTSRGKHLTSFYIYVTTNQEFNAFVFASATNNFVSYITPDHSSIMAELNEHFLKYLPARQFTVNTYNGGHMTPNKIDEKTTTTHDAFYPYITEGVTTLFREFYESRARVMVFTGLAGTGKSSLMRAMLAHAKDKFVLLDDPSVYDDPKAFNDFLGQVQKMSSDERVTVFLEEADKILQDKKDGNGALERILSTASGVVEHNIKIVIASNVPSIKDLYPALVRGGRAHKVIEFRELDLAEANAARAADGKDPIEFDDGRKGETLATVLNFTSTEDRSIRRAKQVGFMPS